MSNNNEVINSLRKKLERDRIELQDFFDEIDQGGLSVSVEDFNKHIESRLNELKKENKDDTH